MMNRKLFSLSIVFIAACLLFLIKETPTTYSVEKRGERERKPEDRIIISHKEIFVKLERPQVVFDHGLHADKFKEEGCKTCHPLALEGNFIFDLPFATELRDKESVRNSYHEKCIGCHKKMINEKKKAGPVKCGKCHVRELEALTMEYPVVEFDFYYHDKHVKKLKKDCSLCHHIYDSEEEDEKLALVYEEGTEESCFYCHDIDKKRGPELTAILHASSKKNLTIRKASHLRCLNCHLENEKKGKEAGPTVCSKCHTGRYRTVAELSKIPRPDRDQPERPLIGIESAKMKGVLFDHRYHEKNNKTCRTCHHETLRACKTCHDLAGKPEGNMISIVNVYHNVFSEKSCAGCHSIKKSEGNCTGCHHHLLDMDLQAKGPKKEICDICHRGKKESLLSSKPISVVELTTRKVPEKVTIKVLENEYEPSTFPHRKIIKKLIEISNKSKIATYFHGNIRTICNGCHHQSRTEAEAKKNDPPLCRNCHSLSFDPQNMNRPRLIAVYHRQCMGCHEKMNLTKPKECTDCHKEKTIRPEYIFLKNHEQ